MQIPIATDSVLPVGAAKACAKFREDRLGSVTVAMPTTHTDRNTLTDRNCPLLRIKYRQNCVLNDR